MKYVIDDEEREVTIITMGKNDTVDDLIAAFEGREEYKVIVMDNPYLEGEYNDIPDEYSDDEKYRCGNCGSIPVNLLENPDHTVWTVEVEAIRKVFATKEDAQKYIDNLISMMNMERMFKVKKLDVNPNKTWEAGVDAVQVDTRGCA